jgi:hypothetical protein
MENALFESENYWLEKLSEISLVIHHKDTEKSAVFEGFAAQGIINTLHQQNEIGHDYADTLERMSNIIKEKGGFK